MEVRPRHSSILPMQKHSCMFTLIQKLITKSQMQRKLQQNCHINERYVINKLSFKTRKISFHAEIGFIKTFNNLQNLYFAFFNFLLRNNSNCPIMIVCHSFVFYPNRYRGRSKDYVIGNKIQRKNYGDRFKYSTFCNTIHKGWQILVIMTDTLLIQ